MIPNAITLNKTDDSDAPSNVAKGKGKVKGKQKATGVPATMLCLDFEDEIEAGQHWSTAELNIEGASTSDLAVVVGELVSEATANRGNVAVEHMSKKLGNLSSVKVINEHIKAISLEEGQGEGERRKIIVRKLGDTRCNLYLLARRNAEGICHLGLMTKADAWYDRLVFYCEWLTAPMKPNGKDRGQTMKHNITALCRSYQPADRTGTIAACF